MVVLTSRMNLEEYCNRQGIELSDFNEDVEVVEGCTDVTGLLADCESFNSTIVLPDSVHILKGMLRNCPNFDKHILLPAEALDCSQMFEGCYSFNRLVRIPPTVRTTYKMFYDCVLFDKQIELPSGIMIYDGMLTNTSAEPICHGDTYEEERLFAELEEEDMHETFSDVYQLDDIDDAEHMGLISIEGLQPKSKSKGK